MEVFAIDTASILFPLALVVQVFLVESILGIGLLGFNGGLSVTGRGVVDYPVHERGKFLVHTKNIINYFLTSYFTSIFDNLTLFCCHHYFRLPSNFGFDASIHRPCELVAVGEFAVVGNLDPPLSTLSGCWKAGKLKYKKLAVIEKILRQVFAPDVCTLLYHFDSLMMHVNLVNKLHFVQFLVLCICFNKYLILAKIKLLFLLLLRLEQVVAGGGEEASCVVNG